MLTFPQGEGDLNNLILARHAESDANRNGIASAAPANVTSLIQAGHEQAKALCRHLAEVEIDLCVTTQLSRTIATADIALEGRTIPRLVLPEFNDPSVGDFEGRSVEKFNAWIAREGPGARPPGGESQHDAMRRYVSGFETILDRPDATILAVIHRLPILWLLRAVESTTPPAEVDFATSWDVDEVRLAQAVAVLRHSPVRPIPY